MWLAAERLLFHGHSPLELLPETLWVWTSSQLVAKNQCPWKCPSTSWYPAISIITSNVAISAAKELRQRWWVPHYVHHNSQSNLFNEDSLFLPASVTPRGFNRERCRSVFNTLGPQVVRPVCVMSSPKSKILPLCVGNIVSQTIFPAILFVLHKSFETKQIFINFQERKHEVRYIFFATKKKECIDSVCNLGIIWFSKLMWFVILSMWNVVPFRLLGGKDWWLW